METQENTYVVIVERDEEGLISGILSS